MTTVTGRVWKFGDDINTDLIIPGFAILLPREEQPQHCFSANRPGWVDQVQEGDVLVAGLNFGVGSGRAIGDVFVQLGITCVVAESFNGLGLRNCINAGLPALPCPGLLDAFNEGDVAEVDWTSGAVRNVTQRRALQGQPLPPALQHIVTAGGVEAMLRADGYLSSR
ncbi:MAG: 3-isopropylmalate/(R)-2-methylmalate dehydratase small subunit [Mycobacterium sp.]|jgi:3-isopropylmalate/(R)-2-methylmalate dehydratase small subunit|nr:3-isopropylmalate/(R)-2-methylmalate dehydratase small subunit [Mycobacterium sp.]